MSAYRCIRVCMHVCMHACVCICGLMHLCGMQQDRGVSVCGHEVGSHSSPSAVGVSETRLRADALLSLSPGSAPEFRHPRSFQSWGLSPGSRFKDG